MADRLLSPLVFHGVKLAVEMKKSPSVDMSASGMNFSTVVQTWRTPMFRTPVRLTAAGIQRPERAIRMDQPTAPPWLTKVST